jgi:hypothetical protein
MCGCAILPTPTSGNEVQCADVPYSSHLHLEMEYSVWMRHTPYTYIWKWSTMCGCALLPTPTSGNEVHCVCALLPTPTSDRLVEVVDVTQVLHPPSCAS